MTKKAVKQHLCGMGGWYFSHFFKEDLAIVTSYSHEKIKETLTENGVKYRVVREYNKSMACTGEISFKIEED
jgi:hypothetical protein